MRLFVKGPDINMSRWHYYGVGNEQFGKSLNRGTVVVGFMAVKGLTAAGAKSILAERERGGEFSSLEDFNKRVTLGRDDVIALCPAGVFDSIALGLPRVMQSRQLLSKRNEKVGMRNGELCRVLV